jgi:predicted P-loop ATPase
MSAQIIQFAPPTARTELVPSFLLIDRGGIDQHVSLLAKGVSSGKHAIAYSDATEGGRPHKDSHANASDFMEHFGVGVKYDTFAHSFYVTGVPQRHKLDDAAFGDIRMAMAATGCNCGRDFLWEFLKARGRESPNNPLLDHLMGLTWDKKPRLEDAIIRHLGAEDSAYTRAVTRAWHIGCVQRLRDPGCKFDNVLTLIGEEGLLKSGFFRAMGYDIYFTDNLPLGADGKVTFEQTRGKWIAELAELVGMAQKESEQVKAFVTRQVDEARAVWDVETSSVPRQFGLAATANKDAPLQGATGNRRWWIVPCTKSCDLVALRSERDQLWAEAVHYAKAGERHWLSGTMEQEARAVQKAHTSVGLLQERIEEALEGMSGFVPSKELHACIGIENKDVSRLDNKHKVAIEAAMARLKFKKCSKWLAPQDKGGKQKLGYESPHGWEKHVLHWDGQQFVQETGAKWLERQAQQTTDTR